MITERAIQVHTCEEFVLIDFSQKVKKENNTLTNKKETL
jgi:hypothetical protein